MIERTEDYRRVKRITEANPISADSPWDLIISRDFFYLIEVQDGKDVGVWCFEPDVTAGHFIHTAMTPECRGKAAVNSALNAFAWMYENTDADQIIAPISIPLRHSQIIARSTGLDYIGNQDGNKLYKMTRDLFAQLSKEAA